MRKTVLLLLAVFHTSCSRFSRDVSFRAKWGLLVPIQFILRSGYFFSVLSGISTAHVQLLWPYYGNFFRVPISWHNVSPRHTCDSFCTRNAFSPLAVSWDVPQFLLGNCVTTVPYFRQLRDRKIRSFVSRESDLQAKRLASATLLLRLRLQLPLWTYAYRLPLPNQTPCGVRANCESQRILAIQAFIASRCDRLSISKKTGTTEAVSVLHTTPSLHPVSKPSSIV